MKRRSVICKRTTPTGTDPVTGDRRTGTTTDTTIDGCLVAPRYSDEPRTQGRNGVIVGQTLYAPPGADLQRHDKIDIDGTIYDIEGEPGIWTGSRVGGVEAALRRTAG